MGTRDILLLVVQSHLIMRIIGWRAEVVLLSLSAGQFNCTLSELIASGLRLTLSARRNK